MGRASLGAPVPRARMIAGLLAGVLLLAASLTWFVVSRRDDARSVTEPSAERAVDGFARAYSRGDDSDVRARTCTDTRSLVLVSVDDNRRRTHSLHRLGAVQQSDERVITGGTTDGLAQRAVASAQLAGPGSGSRRDAASSGPTPRSGPSEAPGSSGGASPSGSAADVVSTILVRQNADGGWCVLTLTGEFHTLPA